MTIPHTDSKYILIPASLKGERLDKALALVDGELSRSAIVRLIQDGCLTRHGQRVDSPSLKVAGGEQFVLALPAPTPLDAQPEEIPLQVVYEDDDLVVIDKPAGMVVHPGAGVASGTLVNALLHHCDALSAGSSLTGINGVVRPGVVHRLDKETSGLLVAAKNDKAHLHLAAQFKDHTIGRQYLAVLVGVPRQSQGRVETQLGRHPVHRQKMAVLAGDKGRLAITHYQVAATCPPLAVVRCRLETGRTHQIRVHMAHLGHPLLGDPVYGRPFQAPHTWPQALRQAAEAFDRQALHAEYLAITHPTHGQRLTFHAPPPADLANLLALMGVAWRQGRF